MGFPRQEYWSGLPVASLGDLPDPGIELYFLHFLQWQVDSLPLALPAKPHVSAWEWEKILPIQGNRVHLWFDTQPLLESHGQRSLAATLAAGAGPEQRFTHPCAATQFPLAPVTPRWGGLHLSWPLDGSLCCQYPSVGGWCSTWFILGWSQLKIACWYCCVLRLSPVLQPNVRFGLSQGYLCCCIPPWLLRQRRGDTAQLHTHRQGHVISSMNGLYEWTLRRRRVPLVLGQWGKFMPSSGIFLLCHDQHGNLKSRQQTVLM